MWWIELESPMSCVKFTHAFWPLTMTRAWSKWLSSTASQRRYCRRTSLHWPTSMSGSVTYENCFAP